MKFQNFPAKQAPIKSGRAGFTLIELLIVVALIGVLSASVFSIMDPVGQGKKANDARKKSDFAQLQRALEIYYSDFDEYPPSTVAHLMQPSGFAAGIAWGGDWNSSYRAKLPSDPNPSLTFVYISTGQSYRLYAHLERATDPQACAGAVACPGVPAGVTCGSSSEICNYGVTSPNITP